MELEVTTALKAVDGVHEHLEVLQLADVAHHHEARLVRGLGVEVHLQIGVLGVLGDVAAVLAPQAVDGLEAVDVGPGVRGDDIGAPVNTGAHPADGGQHEAQPLRQHGHDGVGPDVRAVEQDGRPEEPFGPHRRLRHEDGGELVGEDDVVAPGQGLEPRVRAEHVAQVVPGEARDPRFPGDLLDPDDSHAVAHLLPVSAVQVLLGHRPRRVVGDSHERGDLVPPPDELLAHLRHLEVLRPVVLADHEDVERAAHLRRPLPGEDHGDGLQDELPRAAAAGAGPPRTCRRRGRSGTGGTRRWSACG